MRDLFLTIGFPPDVGGIQRFVFEIAKRFKRPVVVTRYFKSSRQFDSTLRNFKVYRSSWAHGFIYKALFAFSPLLAWFFENKKNLESAIKDNNILRIHCMHIFTALLGLYAKYRYGIPFVLYVHCQEVFPAYYPRYNPFASFLRNLAFSNAARVYVISNYIAGYLSKAVDLQKMKLIPLGVDLNKFRPNRNSKRIKNLLGSEKNKILLTVSRLEEYKGIDYVIKSLSIVRKIIPNLKYVIIGDGEDKERLVQIAKNEGVEDMVILLGNVSDKDLPFYYNACDVFILNSRNCLYKNKYCSQIGKLEGFGLVFLEAGACAKPVIGGNSGGVSEAILHGKTGFLVNPLDRRNIARMVIRLVMDKSLASRLGKNGRKRVLSTHNFRACVESIKADLKEHSISRSIAL